MSSERSVKDVFGPYTVEMERAMGIEPTSEAWEAKQKQKKRSFWRLFDDLSIL